jgi:hypothetical protein
MRDGVAFGPAASAPKIGVMAKQIPEKCPTVFRQESATNQRPKQNIRWRAKECLLRAFSSEVDTARVKKMR